MTAATKSFTGRKRIRKTFGRIPEITRMPNLIEVQKRSYDHFLQFGVTAEKREDVGLQEVFKSVFPIKDFSERSELRFVRYELEDPKYDDAVRVVLTTGQASASYLQRRLKLGYSRAARLIEIMEANGVVGPSQGSKPREVLIRAEDYPSASGQI